MTLHLRLPDGPSARQQKVLALVLLAIPVAVLLLFAFGEMAGGDISGVQHIPEAALLLALVAAAWRYPRGTGAVLLALGGVLLAGYLALAATRVVEDENPLPAALTFLIAAFVLFVPPLAAGWLLWRAGSEDETF